jgi:DEAD/DEAH box helicase domain-containing protein
VRSAGTSLRRDQEMTPNAFLSLLRADKAYRGQIVHVELLSARPARFARTARPLHPALAKALAALGAARLFTHQARAIDLTRDGRHVVVATGTSSGKSLCYNVPVLEAVLAEPRSRALYVFPTKALAQDQMRALGELQQRLPSPRVGFGAYDGDTPREQRTELRQSAHIVVTNPDMLSVGILPNHRLWASLFAQLRYVVVDEAHIYRGVFGSQVACVLRRLRRICAHYGRNPQFICCTATIANPGEHVLRLAGVEAQVVEEDGAPRGARSFALWNPQLVDRRRSVRRSAGADAATLFAVLVQNGQRTIAFARTRRAAELLLSNARDQLRRTTPALAARVRSYRAGYLAEDRRAIERGLVDGQLLGVTATNALELGIDIGDLDATLLAGYPGTIASVWQQAGRAGRGTRDALTILVGEDDPLNQFFMLNSAALFAQPMESALIHPDNVYILEQQLPCAAHELPLTSGDEQLFGPGFVDAMIRLERAGLLQYEREQWTYQGGRYPAQEVTLRAAARRTVRLVHERDPRIVIEEIDGDVAVRRAHEGAIYLHQGESYLVTKLDLGKGIATAKPVDVAYYTEPREIGQTYVVRALKQRAAGSARATLGDVRVSQRVIGYRRRQQFKEEVMVDVELDYPAQSYETRAVWWDIPAAAIAELRRERRDLFGALHATEHVCASMLPLFAMCDRGDIGSLSTISHPDTQKPQIFIYDSFAGGVGISEQGYAALEQLWQAALQTIDACACEAGCPSCVQSPRCGSNNEPLDKLGAALLLRNLLRQEKIGATDAARRTVTSRRST